MAYMSQERKSKIAALIKPILKEYGIKATLSVCNHNTICLNIKSGAIDFIENYNNIHYDTKNQYGDMFVPEHGYIPVNCYHLKNYFNGKALDFIEKCNKMLNMGNHNNSMAEIDYYDVGWYVDINIGKWNKPYIVT